MGFRYHFYYSVGIVSAVGNSYIRRSTGNFYKFVFHVYLQKDKKELTNSSFA